MIDGTAMAIHSSCGRSWWALSREAMPPFSTGSASPSLRSKQRPPAGGASAAPYAEPVAPDATDEIARRAGLLEALLVLPLRQRATVILRYLEGMSERETAAVLGCSEGTVKSQAARALGTLRNFLERTESML